jgi:hypothetical protein
LDEHLEVDRAYPSNSSSKHSKNLDFVASNEADQDKNTKSKIKNFSSASIYDTILDDLMNTLLSSVLKAVSFLHVLVGRRQSRIRILIFRNYLLMTYARFFLGIYKIKLARAYVEEHFDEEGDYIIELNDNTDDILRCTIQSRHSNSTKYKC